MASAYRGKKARQHAAEEGAARKIESIWRGHAARVPIARERLEAGMNDLNHECTVLPAYPFPIAELAAKEAAWRKACAELAAEQKAAAEKKANAKQ